MVTKSYVDVEEDSAGLDLVINEINLDKLSQIIKKNVDHDYLVRMSLRTRSFFFIFLILFGFLTI